MAKGKKDKEETTVPYSIRTTPAWLKEVDSWDWEERSPGDWTKSGVCHRCKHEFRTAPATIEIIMGLNRLANYIITNPDYDGPMEAPPRQVFLYCECLEYHEGGRN